MEKIKIFSLDELAKLRKYNDIELVKSYIYLRHLLVDLYNETYPIKNKPLALSILMRDIEKDLQG